MASFPEGPAVDILHGHKREQSQDSGAYIDWNSEDSASPTGNLDPQMKGEFVTVVAVESGSGSQVKEDSPFVTVLEITDGDGKGKGKTVGIEDENVAEEVLVYRLPGERLGFGLKFEGGTNTVENVKRLFIQSSAPDSPASRAECSWGSLVEGDEILKIDGHDVSKMTRLDCVRCLKESSVVIKLYVSHANRSGKQTIELSDKVLENSNPSSTSPLVISAEMKKKVPPPPPIPPRKIPRKTIQKDELTVVGPPEEFSDLQQVPVPKLRSIQTAPDDSSASKNQSKSSVFVPAKEVKQDLPDTAKKLSKRSIFDLKHIPPEPEVYLDLLAQEDMKSNWESESDDTGSTISTVMGFSLSNTTNSSFSDFRSNTSSNCDSTTSSTPTSTPSTPLAEVAKVLIPFQSSDTNDFLFTKMINDKVYDNSNYDEKSSVCSDDIAPLQPPLSFQDAPLSYGNEELKVMLTDPLDGHCKDLSKNGLDENAEEVDISTAKTNGSKSSGSSKKTSLIPRLAKSIGLLSPPKPSPRKESENGKSRSNKKRPPPPPPPPPQLERPPSSEPEAKTLKSSIPYLKKKKTKTDQKPEPKLEVKSEASKAWEEPVEAIVASEPESTTPEELEEQDVKLCWPVPELKNLRQRDEERLGLVDATGTFEPGGVLNERPPDSSGNEFETESAANRDSYFTFQWAGLKQLETIGEDEEDGCNDEASNGRSEEINRKKTKDVKIAFDIKVESAEPPHCDGDNAKGKFVKDQLREAEEERTAESTGNSAPDTTEKEVLPEEKVDECEAAGDSNVKKPQDEFLEEAEGITKDTQELCPTYNSDKAKDERQSKDVSAELKTDGDLVENMMPVVTAAIGVAPPPAFSRLPPDGHEFPQNYKEESLAVPEKLGEDIPIIYGEDLKPELPPLPTTEPPTCQKYSFRLDGNVSILPSKKTLSSDVSRPNRSKPWRQDEKSEKSVRDKIAMFSSVTDSPISPANSFCSGKLSKYKSSDDVFYDDEADCVRASPNEKHISRSIVSIDKIGGLNGSVRPYSKKIGYDEPSITSRSLDYTNRAQSSMDLTSSSSSAYSSSCSPDSSLSSTTSSYLGYSSTLPRKNSRSENAKNDAAQKTPKVTRATSFSIHGRSQSLLDINPSPYKARLRTDNLTDDEQKQSSLNLLVEQRRKNLTKLRGLVIPEKLTDPPPNQTIFDLPEIKSRDLILTSKLPNAFREEVRSSPLKWESMTAQPPSPLNLSSPPWKDQIRSPNVPKYSPAFKRKSISVYASATSPVKKEVENGENERLKPPTKPPRSLPLHHQSNGFLSGKNLDALKTSPTAESKCSPDPSKTYCLSDSSRSMDLCPRKPSPHGKCKNFSDAGRPEEDSDNDSAVSSSRSSISHGFSPPSSPLLDNQHQSVEEPTHRNHLFGSSVLVVPEKLPLTRTLSSDTTASGASNTSTLTSGSQASCSSNASSDCSSRRILKAQSVEAINRKNVLASAKYSRGFDVKSGSPLIQRKFTSSDSERLSEDVANGKDSDTSFGSYSFSVTDVRKFKDEPTNYVLASDISEMNAVPNTDVKIAFLNKVEPDGDTDSSYKRRLTKTESFPSASNLEPQKATLRRTSVPFTGSQWDTAEEDWSKLNGKPSDNCRLPLTTRPSTESLRSRASSVDTIIENIIARDAGPQLGAPRSKTARNLSETETRSSKSSIGTGALTSEKSVSPYGKSLVGVVKARAGSLKDADDAPGISSRGQRSVSVNDIRKAFEKVDVTGNGRIGKTTFSNLYPFGANGNHVRVSSLDSTNSEDSCAFAPGPYGSSSSLHREQFGSITSLASSTSLISPQELQLLIDEANQTLEESGGSLGGSTAISHDVLVVILHRDTAGGSVGITLAGGADYESKEITVHKVLTGSPADRDGRIQKGDRILSINGKSMKGATHRESLAILKSPRPEVVLVVSRPKSESNCDTANHDDIAISTAVRPNSLSSRPPRILEGTMLNSSVDTNNEIARGPPITLMLNKDGAGLGFSLEGGKDSPVGDKPLIIKKIFTGGAAEKCGNLKAGDEILNVNGIDVTIMSRIEAWKLMKRIPDGNVSITVRHQVENASAAAAVSNGQ